jgi:hypothetical protein
MGGTFAGSSRLTMTTLAEPRIPTSWPTFLTAGATCKVDRVFRDYNNTQWTLAVYLVGNVVADFTSSPEIIADPDGSTFHVVLSAVDTAALNPSGGASLPYTIVERLTATTGSPAEVWDVGTGRIMVSPNVATASAGDFVSPEEKILGQLQTALAARLTGNAVESYSIAGRSLTKISTKELRDMIGGYKWMVYRQRNPGRVGAPGEFSLPVERGTAPYPWNQGRTRYP